MAYVAYKNSSKRTASDKVLCDQSSKMQKIQNMLDIKEDLLQWLINFLIKG